MSDGLLKNLPQEKLSFSQKGKEWRKQHVDWGENYVWNYDSRVRKSFTNKMVNLNLVNGKLSMDDLQVVLNPNNIQANFMQEKVQHYPIINSKMDMLAGEEHARPFNYRVVVTNQDGITEIENNKKGAMMQALQEWVTSGAEDEEQAQQELEKIAKYYKYEWQDLREIRGNALVNHYVKELNMQNKFNKNFYLAMTVGEENYQLDIVGGEPTFEIINPLKMIVIKNGYSTRTEDADMIVLWDYWSPGRVIDTYYDVLTNKDVDYISKLPFATAVNDMDNIDPMNTWAFVDRVDGYTGEGVLVESQLFNNNIVFDRNFTDNFGNVRVIRVYWKSYRKILKVKSYNVESGEEEFHFYPENYKVNEAMGEESTPLWVTEAWEGTKIGEKVYVNMRPRVCQYNRLSNPSRCHFGIIGSVYNMNDDKPFSLVDRVKPYLYLFDVIHDRLNKNLAASWGKIGTLDLAKIPKDWDIEKWGYYAKTMHLNIIDSFKEGNYGASRGKLAGMLSGESGSLDLDQGQIIQEDIQLLEYIENKVGDITGISKQREGQINNRETVGGVERSVLQSSHITEWLYIVHDDVKRRCIECLLETAKIALKGSTRKFQYLLDDATVRIVDFDGDEFAESDYGLFVEDADKTQAVVNNLTQLAQAMVQNQTVSMTTLIKLWTTTSVSDMIRSIREDEEQAMQRAQEAQQQQMQLQQQQMEQQALMEQEKLRVEEERHIREAETAIVVAQIKADADLEMTYGRDLQAASQERINDDKLAESKRQFNAKLQFDKEKLQKQLAIDKEKVDISRRQASKNNNVKK
jgi:hypothetical protein